MSVINIDGITVEITRKKVRNLNLRVVPPDGRVIVSVPNRMNIDKAGEFIRSKSGWIIKQQKKMRERTFDLTKDFVNGEEHYLFGKAYTLEISPALTKEGVMITGDQIFIYTKEPESRERNEMLLDRWYRKNLQENIPGLISRWEKIIGVNISEFRIRKMTTRWGTCNTAKRRILLNLNLAKRRPALIEYIVVHELVHLLERGHNKRFYAFMDQFLPDWKELRRELR